MDCNQRTATPVCHESMTQPDGPFVRGTHHPCDHDHTAGNLAPIAGPIARDSVGAAVAVPLPGFTSVFVPNTRLAVASLHGPPGSDRRSTSLSATVLRI